MLLSTLTRLGRLGRRLGGIHRPKHILHGQRLDCRRRLRHGAVRVGHVDGLLGLLHRRELRAATEEALRPKPRLTAEECSPTGVEAQHAFFLEHGFVFLRDVLPPEMLPRAQAAWTAAEERAQAEWEAKMAAGADGLTQQDQRFFDLPNLLSEDDVFIDMVDSPALVPVLSRLTGSEQALSPDSTIRAAG